MEIYTLKSATVLEDKNFTSVLCLTMSVQGNSKDAWVKWSLTSDDVSADKFKS